MEHLAEQVYESAGFDPAWPPGLIRVARALPNVTLLAVDRLATKADSFARGSRRVIRLRSDLTALAANLILGHEIAHGLDGSFHDDEPAIERQCTQLGAMCVVPRAAMFRCRMAFGWEFSRYSSECCASQTTIALRWTECFSDEPTAIVTPEWTARRGPAWFPSDGELRKIVASGGCQGVRVVPLTDKPNRWLIVGET